MNKLSMRVLARITALGLAIGATLIDAPSATAAGMTQADIFNPAKVNTIELTIPSASAAALNNTATAKTYTAASFKITANGNSMGPVQIGLRLKGSTSLELLNRTPSFKVSFNWSALKGQRLLGLKNLTLNAMTQDSSKLHEFASYKLFNAMNVPAPRTGWANLIINGQDRGLYISIETVDDIFLGTRYTDVTQHLYEGVALKDLKPGHDDGAKDTGSYLVKEGWGTTPNKNDLTALIAKANVPTGASWWAGLAKVTDRSELVRMWAVENFAGQWDGYSGPIINNHFWRSNVSGKFSLLPWGTDQTFGENRQTPIALDDYFFAMDKPQVGFPWVQQAFHKSTMDRGMLFQKCLAYKPCKTEYLLQLKAVSAKVTSMKLVTAMKNAASVIKNYTTPDNQLEQMRTWTWVGKQQAKVAALLRLNKIK